MVHELGRLEAGLSQGICNAYRGRVGGKCVLREEARVGGAHSGRSSSGVFVRVGVIGGRRQDLTDRGHAEGIVAKGRVLARRRRGLALLALKIYQHYEWTYGGGAQTKVLGSKLRYRGRVEEASLVAIVLVLYGGCGSIPCCDWVRTT